MESSAGYDSLEVLQNKYEDAQGHVDKLREGGASVLFQIDATRHGAVFALDVSSHPSSQSSRAS